MKTWPHSVHSFTAARSFWSVPGVIVKMAAPLSLVSAISASAATALLTTIGFESPSRSWTMSRKP